MSDHTLTFAIVTCSDTRSMKEDTAGAALETLIAEKGWTCASHVVVKDERADIAAAIVAACDELDADIVLTCGGSGLSLRDVTPEATLSLIHISDNKSLNVIRCYAKGEIGNEEKCPFAY